MSSEFPHTALLSTQGGSSCPVCSALAVPRIDLIDYRLFECPHCGCWSSDALARAASTSFDPVHYFENAQMDEEKWESLLQRPETEGRPLRRVLDVGCGNGAYLNVLGRRLPGVERVGIELDAARAAQARDANPSARILVGDALESLAALAPPFDLITLWDVFEHVPAPACLLEKMATLLAPKGTIYIQTINERSLVPALGRLAYRLSGGRVTAPARRTHEAHHLVFFTRDGLSMMADRAGLAIRALWFDRLAHARMDGHPLMTAATSLLLAAENALGNGLFVNLLLEPAPAAMRAPGA
jgi:2-polyprenyl-6-hydroxyphenyl methylase/3-demethylubiquinone-9 3-methyltransferase